MKLSKKASPYWLSAHNGSRIIFGLLHNLVCLCSFQEYEIGRAKLKLNKATQNYQGYTAGIEALQTAMILLLFNILETTSNFLAALAVNTNHGLHGAPKVISPLSQPEIDLLTEQRIYVDHRTGNLQTSSSVFTPVLDKLALVPLILGRLHGITFRLDKKQNEWRLIRRLKDMRDKIIHLRPDFSHLTEQEIVKPSVRITNEDIFLGTVAIRWYIKQITKLLQEMFRGKNKNLIKGYLTLDFQCFIILDNLRKFCTIRKSRFLRDHELPKLLKSKMRASRS